MSAISRTVYPEYFPMGGAWLSRSTCKRVREVVIVVRRMRRHRDESHGKTTRNTSGTTASQPNAVISTAPAIGDRLARCTL
jgi:hypothetical protein